MFYTKHLALEFIGIYIQKHQALRFIGKLHWLWITYEVYRKMLYNFHIGKCFILYRKKYLSYQSIYALDIKSSML